MSSAAELGRTVSSGGVLALGLRPRLAGTFSVGSGAAVSGGVSVDSILVFRVRARRAEVGEAAFSGASEENSVNGVS